MLAQFHCAVAGIFGNDEVGRVMIAASTLHQTACSDQALIAAFVDWGFVDDSIRIYICAFTTYSILLVLQLWLKNGGMLSGKRFPQKEKRGEVLQRVSCRSWYWTSLSFCGARSLRWKLIVRALILFE